MHKATKFLVVVGCSALLLAGCGTNMAEKISFISNKSNPQGHKTLVEKKGKSCQDRWFNVATEKDPTPKAALDDLLDKAKYATDVSIKSFQWGVYFYSSYCITAKGMVMPE